MKNQNYLPSNSVVVNINLSQTSHHLKLVIGAISFNFFILLSDLNKKVTHIAEYFDNKRGGKKDIQISKKQKLLHLHTGKGKQLVTSRTLPTSNPRSCPVTKAGENSLQCLIIFKITCFSKNPRTTLNPTSPIPVATNRDFVKQLLYQKLINSNDINEI